ncbi:MAG: undecaprenyl-diphosphate phosphatase [Clostridiales bacterium]|jgi:undecaprenyl-diphosphatase|nr:undecaprenyl-diphosphate phosphatase [Clostridiales bacterium]
MTAWEAIFLGLLQGLTEFLPVSSSGHLVLAQRILGVKGGVVLFDVVAHLGTLLAVCVCFRKDLWTLAKKPVCKETGLLILATVPAVIVALAFGDFIEKSFGGGYLGWGFLITALMLLSVAKTKRRGRVMNGLQTPAPANGRGKVHAPAPSIGTLQEGKNETGQANKGKTKKGFVGYKAALFMGIAQALAVLPGISRSGATVSGGLFAGAGRPQAARFSFLMSFPVILGAAARELFKLGDVTQSVGALPLALGFAFAAAAGVVSVKFMMNTIRKGRFWPFSIYLFILGAFVLLNQYVLNLF